MYHTYILYTASIDRYYIGQTSQFDERFLQHRSGVAHSTKHASDWKIVFLCCCNTRAEAMKLERRLKRSKSRDSLQRFLQSDINEHAQ